MLISLAGVDCSVYIFDVCSGNHNKFNVKMNKITENVSLGIFIRLETIAPLSFVSVIIVTRVFVSL